MPINKELNSLAMTNLPVELVVQARTFCWVNTPSGPVPYQAKLSDFGGVTVPTPTPTPTTPYVLPIASSTVLGGIISAGDITVSPSDGTPTVNAIDMTGVNNISTVGGVAGTDTFLVFRGATAYSISEASLLAAVGPLPPSGSNGTIQIYKDAAFGSLVLGTGFTVTLTGGNYVLNYSGGGGGSSPYSRPALSSFTWANQSPATVTEISGGPIVMRCVSNGGDFHQSHILYQAAPSAPYTVTGTFEWYMAPVPYSMVGLCLYNTSTTNVTIFGPQTDGSTAARSIMNLIKQANPNTFTSAPKFCYHTFKNRLRLRIVNDSTNVTYLFSTTGQSNSWVQFYQETVSSAGNPTSIGWYVNPNDRDNVGYPSICELFGWEVAASASPQAASALAGV